MTMTITVVMATMMTMVMTALMSTVMTMAMTSVILAVMTKVMSTAMAAMADGDGDDSGRYLQAEGLASFPWILLHSLSSKPSLT